MIATVWRGSRFHTLLGDGGYAKRSCQRRFPSGFGELVDKILLQSHGKNGRAEETGHGVQVQISERFLGVNSANAAAPLLGGRTRALPTAGKGRSVTMEGTRPRWGPGSHTPLWGWRLKTSRQQSQGAKPGLLPRCAPADPSFPGEVGTGEMSWKCLQFTRTLPSSLTGEEVADRVHNSCYFSSSSPAKPLSFLPARFLCSRT